MYVYIFINMHVFLSGVDSSVLPFFEEAAKHLILQMGPEKALCAALAKISGDNIYMNSHVKITYGYG
jgi:hypothetical protein